MLGNEGVSLPPDHPSRLSINNEVHARPPEALPERARITYLVLLDDPDMSPVCDLCERFGVESPAESARHFSADLGPFRLKWERHTEFTRYWFITPAKGGAEPFSGMALKSVPEEWLKSLSGEVLAANNLELVPRPRARIDENRLSQEHFAGNMVIGSEISGGRGLAFTDFRIHADGFGRILVYENGQTPHQRGRNVQRLLEIDTYRVLALLALPIARGLVPMLGEFERELTEITEEMRDADHTREPELLDRLTLLHANIVREHTASQFRFSAATAYAELVDYRISELREQRIEGLQTFAEFTERRLLPAMKTCQSTANWLSTVSQRVARATQLLSTRVDITREKQNQVLLESMNRRARLQLRLQQTVEGLSIAAITYYIVGLVGYAAKGANQAGLIPWSDTMVTAVSIIPVVAFVAWGVRHVRKAVTG